MKFEFHDTFAGHADHEYPAGWQLERHSGLSHRHAYVMDGALALMAPGNKHLPITPPLADFTLELDCRGDRHFHAVAGIVIYFRYDPAARRGYYIHCQWGADGVQAEFGVHEHGRHRPLQSRQSGDRCPDTSAPCALRLVAVDNRFAVTCGGTALDPFLDPDRTCRAGRIALDQSGAVARKVLGRTVYLDAVRIASPRDFPARDLWAPMRVEIPAGWNGMLKPFVFDLAAREIGGCCVLTVRLTGGSTKQPPDCPGGFYTCNEEMRDPYVRLETAAGADLGVYRLLNGTVGLRDADEKRNFAFFPADAECPVTRTIYLADLPADARLFAGYASFRHQMAPHLGGGSTEAWVDPLSGRLKYLGAPLRAGCRVAAIQSPEDKEICRRLPDDDPRHDQALAFARANHFFMDREPCAFTALLRLRDASVRPNEWTATARLEDACREPLPVALQCVRRPPRDPLSADLKRDLQVETLAVDIRVPDALPVGVYHLAVQWHEGTQAAVEQRCAFEVMPADPRGLPAPLASGLPELVSFPDEARGLTTNVFDPWLPVPVDACHYVTTLYYQAEFARAQRVWTTLHAYRRRWQLGLARNCASQDSAGYADLVREADVVCGGFLPGRPGRRDLWKRAYYRGALLDDWRRFVRERVPDGDEQRRLTETEPPKGVLTAAAFQRLAERHWKPWLDYYRTLEQETLRQASKSVQALNPRARWAPSFYAIYPPYGVNYKSGYFPLYMGYDVTQEPLRSLGPVCLEDYPYLCRYGMLRGVYQLAAMKLTAPEQKIFLEMYPGASVPVDGLLLCGHPPYSMCRVPPLFFRKRLLAFACGAAWFGRDGFAYWKDRGFHARCWDREHYDTLLSTWSVVRRLRPARPLRSAAFAFSLDACRAHPDYFEPNPQAAWGDDVYNTAEEGPAYAYEQAQHAGVAIGFLLDLDAVGKLDPADVDILVLPPLSGLSRELLEAIREKHQQGVALVGFEDVTGLEDLFGVAPRPAPAPVHEIRLHPACASEAPWRELAGLRESCQHPLCQTRYQPAGAAVLLEGRDREGRDAGPVLTRHRTAWGETALWCVPPTVVNRADQTTYVQYGQACLSRLMNRAMTLVMRALARPLVETSAGKAMAFHDEDGGVRVIVMEDAWPDTPQSIAPRVTVRLPNIRRADLACDRPFSILSLTPAEAALRLRLDPHDSAVITIAPNPRS